MRSKHGSVDPVGLYDLDRKIRPVGEAYKQLISDWRQVLPTNSICLQVPIDMPGAYDDTRAAERRRFASDVEDGSPTEPSNAEGGRT